MKFFTILATAFAACNLDDGNLDAGCNVDTNGWANLDHDSITGGFTLAISSKASTIDADGIQTHGATNGAPTWFAADNRYVLDCPQTAAEKTVKFTITRPATLTSFGAEWVQMFPKDSWENVTNEYEPFSFNDYGSKIPLNEFRPQSDPCLDGTLSDGVTTCVEGFTQEDNQAPSLNVFMEVSVEGDFEIKYGNPKTVSSGVVGEADARWVAHEFKQTLLRVGNPWSDCSAGAAGTNSYGSVGTIIPALYGNPNLNIDTYNSLIADLAGTAVPTKIVIAAYGNDLDAWTESAQGGNDYTVCYRAGNGCPLNHEVCDATYCNLDRWRQIVDDLNSIANVEVLAHVETHDGAARDNSAIIADINSYKAKIPAVKGYYFNQANGGKASVDNLLTISDSDAEGFVVFASGEPLFDKSARTAAGAPDVWVTLAADFTNMGIWTPFSWFSDVAASQWGAIVNTVPEADISVTATSLFDRGYGWVYLHSAASFSDESSSTIAAIDAVEDRATRRLTESRRLLERTSISEPEWGCDDTLFECRPVCIKTNGVTTSKVNDAMCASAPLDACSCPCYYDAKWDCQGDDVVCKATMRDEETVVGDTLCSSRGTPKPTKASLVVSGTCAAKGTTRGAFPAQACVDGWSATTSTTTTSTTTTTTTTTTIEKEEDITIESFAAPAVLAAIYLVQA